ncbi:MAG: hypothetical protein ACRDTD_23510 [Pseudonocardiaceae bacterium]
MQHEVAKAAEVAQAVQAETLLIDLQPVTDELEESYPEVAGLEDRAGLALDAWGHGLNVVLKLRQQIGAAGHRLPYLNKALQRWILVGTVLAALSELFILGPAFQVLGLSDEPVIPLLPFNAQHVAALGSVMILIWLAHGLGKPVASPTAARPTEKVWQRLWAVGQGHWLNIFGVSVLLLGLATVRETYLVQKGTVSGGPAVAIGFLMLNIGFVLGVRYLSRSDQRPFADAWQGAVAELTDKADHAEAVLEEYESAAGGYNANVARRENRLHETDVACDAIVADAERQLWLIVGETRLALREPVDVAMFSADMPAVMKYAIGEEINQYLRGEDGTRFHRYERFDTKPIRQRFAELHRMNWAGLEPAQLERRTRQDVGPADGSGTGIKLVQPKAMGRTSTNRAGKNSSPVGKP